jgi:hypothetical protein
MIVVRELRQISADSPAQWRGRVGDHGSIHIRYRWGVLTARVSENSSDLYENSQIVFDQDVAERMSGYLTTAEMQAALAPVCHFVPEESKS